MTYWRVYSDDVGPLNQLTCDKRGLCGYVFLFAAVGYHATNPSLPDVSSPRCVHQAPASVNSPSGRPSASSLPGKTIIYAGGLQFQQERSPLHEILDLWNYIAMMHLPANLSPCLSHQKPQRGTVGISLPPSFPVTEPLLTLFPRTTPLYHPLIPSAESSSLLPLRLLPQTPLRIPISSPKHPLDNPTPLPLLQRFAVNIPDARQPLQGSGSFSLSLDSLPLPRRLRDHPLWSSQWCSPCLWVDTLPSAAANNARNLKSTPPAPSQGRYTHPSRGR